MRLILGASGRVAQAIACREIHKIGSQWSGFAITFHKLISIADYQLYFYKESIIYDHCVWSWRHTPDGKGKEIAMMLAGDTWTKPLLSFAGIYLLK